MRVLDDPSSRSVNEGACLVTGGNEVYDCAYSAAHGVDRISIL